MQAQHDAVATMFILGLISSMSGGSSSQPEPAASPDYDFIECKRVEGVERCNLGSICLCILSKLQRLTIM